MPLKKRGFSSFCIDLRSIIHKLSMLLASILLWCLCPSPPFWGSVGAGLGALTRCADWGGVFTAPSFQCLVSPLDLPLTSPLGRNPGSPVCEHEALES